MLLNLKYLIFFGLLFVSQFVSAGLWMSSNTADVSSITIARSGINNAEIGIFTSSKVNASEPLVPVAKFDGNGVITFVRKGDDWDVSVAGQTARLSGTNEFQLGWYINGVWVVDTNVTPNPVTPNLWELTFLDPNNSGQVQTLSINNVEPVPQNVLSSKVSAVPLATTAWGFLSGLLGCLAINKRRSGHVLD